MSDQADHLRQLVRAHRAWRELDMEERSAVAPCRSKRIWSLLHGRARAVRLATSELSLMARATRTARWVLSHVSR